MLKPVMMRQLNGLLKDLLEVETISPKLIELSSETSMIKLTLSTDIVEIILQVKIPLQTRFMLSGKSEIPNALQTESPKSQPSKILLKEDAMYQPEKQFVQNNGYLKGAKQFWMRTTGHVEKTSSTA
jgi:hypothetical protein